MNKIFPVAVGVAALMTSLAISTDISAKPALRAPINVSQPDGSELTIYLHGDEHFHFITTADGHLLSSTPDQGYVYADITDDGLLTPSSVRAHDTEKRTASELEFISRFSEPAKLRAIDNMRKQATESRKRESQRNYIQLNDDNHQWNLGRFDYAYPVQGSPKALVVLVEYKDVSFTIDNPAEYFEALLNQEGFEEYGATGSVSDWFKYNSDGKFTPDFDLYGPVKLENPRKFYGENDRYGNDRNPWQMIIDAIEALDEEVDFSQYDTDHDGYIDNVFVFYAGKGEADGGGEDTVWPHSFDIKTALPNKVFEFDGVILNRYACSNEYDSQYRRPDGIGTFVHEFSHVMGLPDLYPTNNNNAVTPGQYSVLDYGPYNNQGRTPPNYSSFERNALGWLKPTLFDEDDENVVLHPLADSNECFLVPTEQSDEFFLFEYRPRTGNDKYIPAGGMIIWQVDFDKKKWTYNTVNNDARHQNVMMIKADNKNSTNTLSGDTWPGRTKNTSFGPETSPAFISWAKKSVGVTIEDIFEDKDENVITFSVKLDDDYNWPQSTGIENTVTGNSAFAISVDEISAEEPIVIYSPDGRIVKRLSRGENYRLPKNGIYIIKSESKTFKIAR